MAEVVEEALAAIRDTGGRVTPVRRTVLEAVFAGDQHHFTAAEIVAAVAHARPRPDRATIYRTLDLLADLGYLTPLQLDGDATVFHRADHRHGHLVCDRCGTVIELPMAMLATIRRNVDARLGFAIDTHRVTIPGVCATCQAAATRPGTSLGRERRER